MSGPTTRTAAEAQSDLTLPATGRIAWAIRGARSRAGLIAYPVVPPSERPIPQTRQATRYAPSPEGNPAAEDTALEKMAATTNTRTSVPMISLTRFAMRLRIAGAVQNTANFKEGSGVSFQ